ncbi:unnamed protein product [Caenorhabditis angaria]|uniref:Uncharacterized protein n=1 Tax=Caenorhabditis angaria TaxID=860376 RepID=A0A9P1IN81_9PELO|nr:unnamed protein product [Caenorhabditis angaria]
MSKAYILIEIPKDRRSRDISNLRKYLKNHNFSKFETNEPVEIISQLLDPAPDYYDQLVRKEDHVVLRNEEDKHVIIRENSNQELLENWARETFEENSDEMKLLLSDETNDIQNRNLKRPSSFNVEDLLDLHEDEDREAKQSSVQTISSDTNSRERYYSSSSSDTVVDHDARYFRKNVYSDEEESHEQRKMNSTCNLCDKLLEAGSKKSQLRAQLSHIIREHAMCNVLNEHLIRRYQCQACNKYLSSFVPPCEHINTNHRLDTFEIRFNDLWTKKQIDQCNVTLRMCFGRHLPIPRGRRATNVYDQKSNYTIISHEELESGEASSSRTIRTQRVGLSTHTMGRKYGVSARPRSFGEYMNLHWLDSDEDQNDHEEKEEEEDQEDESEYQF